MARKTTPDPTEMSDNPPMPKPETRNPGEADVPDGFEPVGLSGPAKWHVCEVGNAVCGVLLSRGQKRAYQSDDMKAYYQIQLTRGGTRVAFKDPTLPRDAKAVVIEAEVGDIVCIDERADLVDFRSVAADASERNIHYEVYIKPVERIPTGGGKTFWRYIKLRSHRPWRGPFPKKTVDDDNIPF